MLLTNSGAGGGQISAREHAAVRVHMRGSNFHAHPFHPEGPGPVAAVHPADVAVQCRQLLRSGSKSAAADSHSGASTGVGRYSGHFRLVSHGKLYIPQAIPLAPWSLMVISTFHKPALQEQRMIGGEVWKVILCSSRVRTLGPGPDLALSWWAVYASRHPINAFPGKTKNTVQINAFPKRTEVWDG